MTKGPSFVHERIGGGPAMGRRATIDRRWSLAAVALAVAMVTASCASSGDDAQTTPTVVATTAVTVGCADVVAAAIESSGDTFHVSATILSADTGWEKYADAWEVRAPDGSVLGTRILAHPHVDEQPFTRSLGDVDIPVEVKDVEIIARDSVAGFCGETVNLTVPGR